MAALVIRNVDEELHGRPEAVAGCNARSIEAEVRPRLRESFATEFAAPRHTLGEVVRAVFGPLGGVEFELPERSEMLERETRHGY